MQYDDPESQPKGDRPFAAFKRLAAYGACAGLVIASGLILFQQWHDTQARTTAPVVTASVEPELKVLQDDWNERITRDQFWRSGRSNSQSAPSKNGRSQLQGPPQPPSWYTPGPSSNSWFAQPQPYQPFWMVPADQQPMPQRSRNVGGYRTVCVRTCDGFFFPVSFGASEASFSRDQATCNTACPGSRLYYYRSSSDDPEDMVDVTGQPYSRLKNANLFRTQYVESCKCKPHPWEQEATDRHRLYALEDQRRKGNRAVVAELESLRTKAIVDKAATRRQSQDKRKRKADEEATLFVPAQPANRPAGPAPRSDVSRGQSGDRTATVLPRPQPAATATAAAPAVAAQSAPAQSAPTQSTAVQSTPASKAQAAPSQTAQPSRVAAGSAQGGGSAAPSSAAPAPAPAPLVAPEPLRQTAGSGASTGDGNVLAPLPASIRPGSSATASAPAASMPSSPAASALPQVAEPLPEVQRAPEKRRKGREARNQRMPQPPQSSVQRIRSADWVARTFNLP